MAWFNMPISYFLYGRWLIMKALNNLGWMLLGVAVGSGALFCYNECYCNGGIKQTINKIKKNANKKLENMMDE